MSNAIFKYYELDGVFFIGVRGNMFNDYEIANMLHLEYKQYQTELIKFNGFYNLNYNNEIFFINKKDANKAIKWIESVQIMNKLDEKHANAY